MSEKTSSGIVTRLSIMMFLQFFVWGAWFVTLGQCLGENGLADFIGGAYGTATIAAILAPLFLGLVAQHEPFTFVFHDSFPLDRLQTSR